ncbi:uncharacterized protein LOC107045254, partial [Diachasma alloeum]|uniref:uncharacterized protein LOC107045254 n=1 Tax=Diachasma alloeum TaxID=454923 RepID=UPI0007383BEB
PTKAGISRLDCSRIRPKKRSSTGETPIPDVAPKIDVRGANVVLNSLAHAKHEEYVVLVPETEEYGTSSHRRGGRNARGRKPYQGRKGSYPADSSKTRGTQRKTVTPARRRKGKATGQTINTPPNPQQNIFDRDFPPFVVEEIGQGDCEDDEPEFTDFEVLEDEDGLMELGLRECDLLDGAEHAFL